MSLHHAESPDSHVVYCRLTKGREVKTVTPGNVNEVPQYHSRKTGRIPKHGVWERKSEAQRRRVRQRGRKEEEGTKENEENVRETVTYLPINLLCQILPHRIQK